MPSGSITETVFNGHSMVRKLSRVMVCSPDHAGWNQPERIGFWQELGFHHPPDFAVAAKQHDELCRQLTNAGVEVLGLPPSDDLSLDAVYAHDASLTTDFGVIVMLPGKPNRMAEASNHREFYERAGLPILGIVGEPGTSEAGDILWLDHRTLLIGQGYRTNRAGISQITNLLAPKGISVLSSPLPYGAGPGACLHLMSLISLLDEKTALVDLPWLAVETVELLKERGFRFIQIDDSERDTLACNVLSLGENRLLAIAENRQTNERLRAAGFDVRTFPGSEICINGSGGPTCLTRPILRL